LAAAMPTPTIASATTATITAPHSIFLFIVALQVLLSASTRFWLSRHSETTTWPTLPGSPEASGR
jgi:hypothetical protein